MNLSESSAFPFGKKSNLQQKKRIVSKTNETWSNQFVILLYIMLYNDSYILKNFFLRVLVNPTRL